MTCWAQHFSTKKDLSGAETAFRKSAELDKNNSEPILKLAQVQAAKGSTDEAIATCRRAIENNPNEPGFYILLGDLYQRRRDWSWRDRSLSEGPLRYGRTIQWPRMILLP